MMISIVNICTVLSLPFNKIGIPYPSELAEGFVADLISSAGRFTHFVSLLLAMITMPSSVSSMHDVSGLSFMN